VKRFLERESFKLQGRKYIRPSRLWYMYYSTYSSSQLCLLKRKVPEPSVKKDRSDRRTTDYHQPSCRNIRCLRKRFALVFNKFVWTYESDVFHVFTWVIFWGCPAGFRGENQENKKTFQKVHLYNESSNLDRSYREIKIRTYISDNEIFSVYI